MEFSQLAAAAIVLPSALVAWRLVGSFLDKFFTRKLTVLHDIDRLGPARARPDKKRVRGTVVICGGSIAGLWTALITADHFENVLIIEPEAWVFTEEGTSNTYDDKGVYIEDSRKYPRSRVAQYKAHHTFQPIVLHALRKYFPDIDTEVQRAHGIIADYEGYCHCHGRRFMVKPRQEFPDRRQARGLYISRELYERMLRRLVLSYSDRIRTKVGTVTGMNTVPGDPMTISSVSVRRQDGSTEEVPAALIIDCTGGSQAGFKWIHRIETDPENLDSLSRYAPSDAIPWDDLRLSYNTRQKYIRFRWPVPPEIRDRLPVPGGYKNAAWMYTYFPLPGKEWKLFMFSRIEGDRIDMTFGGWGEPAMPGDVSEIADWFREFEKDHQKVPDWFYPFVDILNEQRGKVEVSTGKYPNPSWIRYEKAAYIPHNFIALGDAVLQPNPTYGQGCAKATIGAIILDHMLKSRPFVDLTEIPPSFGRNFFKMQADKIKGVWDGTKPTDYQFPTTIPCKGEKLSNEWLLGWFGNIVMELASTDKEVDASLYKVRFFMAPQTALMTPSIMLKILLLQLRKKLGLIQT